MGVATETRKAGGMITKLSREGLEPIVQHCADIAISIYMPVQFQGSKDAHGDAVHLRQLLRTAEAKLQAQGIAEADARGLLQSAQELAAADFLQIRSPAIALFATRDFFSALELPAEVSERVIVSNRFEIKPLLGLIGLSSFYILAISQKHVRLLHATPDGINQVTVHGAPEDLFAAFEAEHFERQMQFHTAAAPRADAQAPRISHGGSWEYKDRIVEFLRKVDHGVVAAIHDQTAPMLLAGVNYLLPMYHEVSAYPALLQEAIPGNPDNLKAEELLALGRKAISGHLQGSNRTLFARYQQLKGAPQASSNTREIVAAADRGHVLSLFVPEGLVQWGKVDGAGEVHLHAGCEPEDEELVNRAAVKTLAHGGRVCSLPSAEFDDGVRLAAIFRY